MPFSHVQSHDHDELDSLAGTLAKASRVVVITGAGISTSCGIPDFRSQDGLYALMKKTHDKSSPSSPRPIKGADLFNSNLFRDEDKSRTFYKFMASLREKCESTRRTSATHKFIGKLRDRQKLVRCYTQNIDGFEAREGICMDLNKGAGNRHRMAKKALDTARSALTTASGAIHDAGCEAVPLHGDLTSLRCTVCSHMQGWTREANTTFLRGEVPSCPECDTREMIRQAMGKRSVRSGNLRPNVILYGEEHPNVDAISRIRCNDLNTKPDLLLVMGTSLKVDGLKMLVKEFAQGVHSKKGGKVIFVNLTQPAASVWGDVFDSWVDMDCDSWVNDMRSRRRELWQTQAQLGDTVSPRTAPLQPAKFVKQTSKLHACSAKAQNSIQVFVDNSKPEVQQSKPACSKRNSADAGLDDPVPRKRKALTNQSGNSRPAAAIKEDALSNTIIVSPRRVQVSALPRPSTRVSNPMNALNTTRAIRRDGSRGIRTSPCEKRSLSRDADSANPQAGARAEKPAANGSRLALAPASRRALALSRRQAQSSKPTMGSTKTPSIDLDCNLRVVKSHARQSGSTVKATHIGTEPNKENAEV